MSKRKNPGGNSHQRSIARADSPNVGPTSSANEGPSLQDRSLAKQRIWPSVFSIPVITTIGGAVITAGGVGVLSMNPPAVKVAYVCFALGYLAICLRISWWALMECADPRYQKAIFIAAVWAATGILLCGSIWFAYSRSPVPLTFKFEAFPSEVGNLPERKEAETWNGGPWDDVNYEDIRLSIENNGPKIQNLDLTLKLVGDGDSKESFYVIPAIGQTTSIGGVEYIPPQPPEITIPLRGQDGKRYTLPMSLNFGKGWSTLPAPSIRVIVPKLLDGQHISLLIGCSHQTPHGVVKEAPPYIELVGTGDALVNGNTRQGILHKQLVPVTRR